MKVDRQMLREITARDSFGRLLEPSTKDLTSFTCTNSNATDIFIKLVFRQKNLIKKLFNTSRSLTVETTKNCTHFSIEGIVKKQNLKNGSSSSIIQLTDSNGNQIVLKEDMQVLNLHIECNDPDNKRPFSFFSMTFNDKQKRKNPENSVNSMTLQNPENNNNSNQLVILSDSDVDSGEFSNSSTSDKENKTSSNLRNLPEKVVLTLSDSPYKKKKMQKNLPKEFSKKCSFPSPNLEFEAQDHNRLVLLSNRNSLKSAGEYFIKHYWKVPGDKFEFQYFQFNFNEFLHKQKLTEHINYDTHSLVQIVGKNIKDQFVIQECPICSKWFFVEELSDHASNCGMEVVDITNNNYTSNSNNFSDYNPSQPRTNSPDIEFVSSSNSNNNNNNNNNNLPLLNTNDIICIDDQKPPSPVRTCYPHFDNVSGPTDKCPVCYLEFRREEIERHTQLCCEKTYESKVRDTFSGGCSSLDHPSTMPAKNRRIIQPKI